MKSSFRWPSVMRGSGDHARDGLSEVTEVMAKRSAPKARSKNKTAVKLVSKARGLVKAALAKAKTKTQKKTKSARGTAARATTKKLVTKSKTRPAEAARAAAPRTASKARAVAPRPVASPPRPSATRAKPKPVKVSKPARPAQLSAAKSAAAPKRVTKKRAPAKAPALAAVTSPAAASNGAELGAGASAPSFELSDEDGRPLSAQALAGKPYVLYFYPKDDTPGCTTQACGFRDALSRFAQRGVRVIGVSPDSQQSHRKFKQKYGLNFTLLSDADKALAQAYGVWTKKSNYGREYMGIERSTFLVDESGTIKKAWRKVRVPGHVDAVLTEVGT